MKGCDIGDWLLWAFYKDMHMVLQDLHPGKPSRSKLPQP